MSSQNLRHSQNRKKKKKKKNSFGISVFCYENKEKRPIYVSKKKCWEDKHADLLLIGEGEKKHYVLIKDFNTFMYDHTLHRGRKLFCPYCLHAFVTEEIVKRHIQDCFKINGKQRTKSLRNVNMLNSMILKEK